MSMFDGLKNVLGINQDPDGDAYIDDTEDEIYAGGKPGAAVPDYAQPEPAQQRNKVVNINATTQLQVVLVKPERFDDASTIADQLNAKRTVVLNLESTNKEVSRRLIDFLSGVAYANNGQIKRVATSTFIITPYNVDIMGDLIDELENNGVFFGLQYDAPPRLRPPAGRSRAVFVSPRGRAGPAGRSAGHTAGNRFPFRQGAGFGRGRPQQSGLWLRPV